MLAAFKRSLQAAAGSFDAVQDAAAAAHGGLQRAAPRDLDRTELAEVYAAYGGV